LYDVISSLDPFVDLGIKKSTPYTIKVRNVQLLNKEFCFASRELIIECNLIVHLTLSPTPCSDNYYNSNYQILTYKSIQKCYSTHSDTSDNVL
jgi:hypothetical protein